MKERSEWLVEVVEAVRAKASESGQFKAFASWDEDGDLELILAHVEGSKGRFHARIAMGDEEDGTRYAFWHLAIQGFGGGHMECTPTVASALQIAHMVSGVFLAEKWWSEKQ